MSFQTPLALLALLAIPALLGLYWLAQRRRRAFTVRFTNLNLLGQVAPRAPGVRRHLPPILFLLASTALLVSFAGPRATISVPKDRSDVMLVIDVSGSMQATDVQPTRLAAARSAARTLIDALPPNASIGLVAFSSRAFVISPLTSDHDAVKSSLDSLQARGGTAIGDGIQLALDQITADPARPRPPSMIVLLTDGVNNAGASPDQAAGQAAAAHVIVNTVGVGSRNGGVFVQGQDVGGVDEQALQSIAQATAGKYFFASEAGQLQQIYSTLGGQFGWRQERVDLTLPVEIGGVVVLLACAALSLRWFRLLP